MACLLARQEGSKRKTTKDDRYRRLYLANLQSLKQNSLEKNTNNNTQESKCTFQSTKQMRPRRGQMPSAQSDKDKKHTQPYKGAITMKDNIWTLLVAAYAHQRPWEECRQSRQCKDAISRGGEEAAASDQVNTIDIRASCMHEAGGTKKGGESRTSHGTKRTRGMARMIANLQRLKRNYLKENKIKNTQEGKCTFRSTKLKRSRREQSEPTSLVAAYAHPDSQS
jgi:hypothetical protein